MINLSSFFLFDIIIRIHTMKLPPTAIMLMKLWKIVKKAFKK